MVVHIAGEELDSAGVQGDALAAIFDGAETSDDVLASSQGGAIVADFEVETLNQDGKVVVSGSATAFVDA